LLVLVGSNEFVVVESEVKEMRKLRRKAAPQKIISVSTRNSSYPFTSAGPLNPDISTQLTTDQLTAETDSPKNQFTALRNI
jgi:hypothetical protein